jgi:SecD/SecF fusion protein
MSPILTFLFGAALLMILLVYVGTTELKRKRILGTLLTVLATALALYTIEQIGLKKGIDLQGGSEFIVELQPSPDADGKVKAVYPSDIQQAITILEKRLNPNGEKDLLLAPQGENRILIQMPGVTEAEVKNVRTQIEKVAKLEFRMVHPDSASEIAQLKASGTLSVDHVEMKSKEGPPLLVKSRPDLDGKYVSRSYAYMDPQKGWTIILEFDSKGGELFGKLTEANVGRQLGIIVDGEVFSAPNLNEAIFGGSASITGRFKEEEARALATILENPLENPMAIVSESSVSAAYGESSINQGKWVAIAGLIMTTCFMLFIYRLAGLIAIVGVLVNLSLLFGGMALFQFTLTMPGIAGIVLTIGMAIDANVLIYERLREEMANGKSLAAALESAYDKAFSAIADSNITTLISAAILFAISGGLVKGFAITLIIGLISSMFGALVVTRIIFMWVIEKGILKKLTTTSIIPDRVFDILSKAPTFIIASLVVTAISFGALIVKGKSSFGIDFRGGAIVHVELKEGKNIADSDLDALLKPLTTEDGKSIGSFYPQRKANATGGDVIAIRSEFEAGPAIEQAIKSKYQDVVQGTQVSRVGASIGSDAAKVSIIAMLVALFGIFMYLVLRFEYAFALGAIVALFHDVLMVPGLCVLFGQELSLIHIGALLTIAGYSINDTIVVFDRIRETIQQGGKGGIRQLMNEAICKTLSRTLLTGPTALAPMVVLLFLGNPAMLEFALPITIGVILGTYSSIFIASPLVLWYAKKTGTSLRRQVMETHLAETITPGIGDQLKESGA